MKRGPGLTAWLVVLLTATVAYPQAATPPQAEANDPVSRAQALHDRGDTAGAIELLKKSGSSGEVRLALGRMLLAANELDLAVDAFAAAADKLKGAAAAEAYGRLSLVQELRGLIPESTASAQAARAADGASAWAAIAASWVAAREGDAAEAMAQAEKAVAAGGGAAAQAALGRAREVSGDLAGAEQAYDAARAEAPGDMAVEIGRARVLRRTYRAEEAEEILKQVLAAAPGAVAAYKEAARVKIALNRPMEALGDAATATAIAPDDPEAAELQKEVTVARAISYLSDPAQAGLAIPDLKSLLEQDPESVIGYVGLAHVYITQRQAEAAQQALDKALALDPDNAEAHYWQGHLHLALKGDFAKAIEPLSKAVAADPANTTYRTEYGLALKQVQRYPEAIAELKTVTDTPGYDRADAWMFLGEAQVGSESYSHAIASLDKAAQIAGESARIEAMLGWAYFGLKDSESFVKHAGKARALGWDEAMLLDRLKRVEAGEAIK